MALMYLHGTDAESGQERPESISVKVSHEVAELGLQPMPR